MTKFLVGKKKLTLQQAVQMSMNGDIIELTKPLVEVTKPITLKQGIKIVGQELTKIVVPNRNVAFYCDPSFKGTLELENLMFEVPNQSFAMRVDSANISLSMKNVYMIHSPKLKNMREWFSSLVMNPNSDTQSVLKLDHCLIDNIEAKVDKLFMSESNFGDIYSSKRSVVFANSAKTTQSAMQNILLASTDQNQSGYFVSDSMLGANTIFQSTKATLSNVVLADIPTINHSDPQNDFEELTSLIVEKNAKVRVNATIKQNYSVDFRTIALNGGQLDIVDTDISLTSLPNIAKSGTIGFESVNDHSQWQVEDKSKITIAKTNSNSMLFSQLADTNKHSTKSALEQINELTGLNNVKVRLKQIISSASSDAERRRRGLSDGSNKKRLHMIFSGNPGTGKTTVARLVAQALYENKVLASQKIVEVGASDLIDNIVGGTRIKVQKKFREALDGVLFIDEAYSLQPKKGANVDYESEAVDQLIKDMDNYSDRVVVILAGYTEQMKDLLATANPGLKSRVNTWVEFEDYSLDELKEIAKYMLKNRGDRARDINVLQNIYAGIEKLLPAFGNDAGNARLIEQYIQRIEEMRDARLAMQDVSTLSDKQLVIIENIDVKNAIKMLEKQAQNIKI